MPATLMPPVPRPLENDVLPKSKKTAPVREAHGDTVTIPFSPKMYMMVAFTLGTLLAILAATHAEEFSARQALHDGSVWSLLIGTSAALFFRNEADHALATAIYGGLIFWACIAAPFAVLFVYYCLIQ